MPSSWTCVTTDVDQFETALRPGDGEVTVTGRGRFEATVVRIDLHRMWMQSAREKLPRTWHAEISPPRGAISLFLEPGFAIQQGVEMYASDLTLKCGDEAFWQQLGPSAHWGSMSLPLEDWSDVASVAAGCEVMPVRKSTLLTPAGPALAALQRLHLASTNLAETAPEMIANPEVARGIEQALIQAVVDCVAGMRPHDDTVARRHHTKIMTQFQKALRERAGKAVYVPELCAAIGVAARTLRLCFQEHVGISPKRYLSLRRMNFARRALRVASPDVTSVTEVAMEYGFWELGRFSVKYKSLFGESPSTTLRQTPSGAGP